MANKKIVAGITAVVLSAGVITGVSAYLNKNYDEYTISGDNISQSEKSSDETAVASNNEIEKVKKAVQNITYESELFGDEIINIDITVDETEWQNMINNAMNEEYINVDININGNVIEDVGIRPKGNSSLSTVADSESDKYSFKMKFDKYVDEQTCYGLDTLVLNNVISDNTYMKDYISFDMMKFMEVDSSLYNYSYITVNGEYWGLYIALEGYDKSFLTRTYGDDSGFLYNVKSMEMDGEKMGEGMMPPQEFEGMVTTPADMTENSETTAVTEETILNNETSVENKMPQMNMMGGNMMNMQDKGGSLIYTDDSWESYSAIFENAVFNRTSEEDYQRVIEALKKLSEGENIDEYFDVDQILRYLAVHTTLVNLDSYSSNMAQNYYLYEKDGKLSILPWDYNLAFGGFATGDTTSAINFPIDTPVSNVSLEERPLIAQILAIDEYKEKYHQYLDQIVKEYFDSGYFDKKVETINNKISTYVKEEPQSFCTYDEYCTAVDTLKNFGKKRAESIKGQLDGSIPSTSEEQQKNSEALVKDESINLGDMGSQMGGKGDRNFGGFDGGRGEMPFETDENGQIVMPEMNGQYPWGNYENGQMPFETDENGQIIRPEMNGQYPWGNYGNGEFMPPEMNEQMPLETDENGQDVIQEQKPFENYENDRQQYQNEENQQVIPPQDNEYQQTQVYQEKQPQNNEFLPQQNQDNAQIVTTAVRNHKRDFENIEFD